MATTETRSKPPVEPDPDTTPRTSKANMSNPIYLYEEYEIIYYSSRKKSLPPPLSQTDLPDDYFDAQRISCEGADDMVFISTCYKLSYRELFNARDTTWQNKMAWNCLELPPKLYYVPPTETLFRENALRGNFAVAISRDCFKKDPPAVDLKEHRSLPEYCTFKHS